MARFYVRKTCDSAWAQGSAWPEELEVPQEPDAGGSRGSVYHLSKEGDDQAVYCCLKQFKLLGSEFPDGADPVAIEIPEEWAGVQNEFAALYYLDGLRGGLGGDGAGFAPRPLAFGVYVDKGLMYPAITMEDFSRTHTTLYELCSVVNRPWSVKETADFGLALVEVIERLQQAGAVHTDLSETNVMLQVLILNKDGELVRPTKGVGDALEIHIEHMALVDFGQCVIRGQVAVEEGGMTLPYAAPERVPLRFPEGLYAEQELVDAHGKRGEYTVDLWSLGALMYRLRLGRTPGLSVEYRGASATYCLPQGTRIDAKDAYFRLIQDKRRGLALGGGADAARDRALDEAVRLCTEPDPGKRGEHFETIKLDLMRAAEGEHAEGGPAEDGPAGDAPRRVAASVAAASGAGCGRHAEAGPAGMESMGRRADETEICEDAFEHGEVPDWALDNMIGLLS